MKKHFTCIMCPIGCEIDVEVKEGKIVTITGNKCIQGKKFVKQEIQNPVRVLTTTIRIENGEYKMLPVRTDKPIPKSLIFKAMEEIAKVKVRAPVKMYEIIIPDILKTGANLVATRSMKKG